MQLWVPRARPSYGRGASCRDQLNERGIGGMRYLPKGQVPEEKQLRVLLSRENLLY